MKVARKTGSPFDVHEVTNDNVKMLRIGDPNSSKKKHKKCDNEK